jgi:hypothetical protein
MENSFIFYSITQLKIGKFGNRLHSARLEEIEHAARRHVQDLRFRKSTSFSTFRHSLKSPSVNAVWESTQRHHAPASRTAAATSRQLASLPARVNKGGVINLQRHAVLRCRLRDSLNINRVLRVAGWLIMCTLPLAMVAIIAAVLVSLS